MRRGLFSFLTLAVSLFWSHLREHRLRNLLTLFGVVLGVAVTLAVRLANTSVERSFVESFEAAAGRSQLEVSRGDLGLEETLLLKVSAVDGVAEVVPRIEENATVAGSRETLLFLGLDLLSANPFRDFPLTGTRDSRDFLSLLVDPHSVLLPRPAADTLGLAPGRRFEVVTDRGAVDLVVRGVIEAGKDRKLLLPRHTVLLDLSAAQWLFRKAGKIDRIGIVLRPEASEAAVRSRIAALGNGSFTVDRPQARTRQIEKMIASFQLNLRILSFLALGVGVFLIYNALSFAVVTRREEIGVLRALGMGRSQILALFLAEGALYGLSGSLLGILLGWGLAGSALKMMARTVGALYVAGVTPRLIADPQGIVLGILLGLGAALAGTLIPALEAARIVPREALSRGSYEERGESRWTLWGAVGLGLLVLAGLCANQKPVGPVPLFGYGAAFLTVAGFAFLSPAAIVLISILVRPLAVRVCAQVGALGVDSFRRALRRNAIAVAALLISVAMLVGLWTMVHSFRLTVEQWIAGTIRADLVVYPAGHFEGRRQGRLDPALPSRIERLPGVEAVDRYREVRISFRGEPVVLASGQFSRLRDYRNLRFRAGDGREIFNRAGRDRGAVVTESFARRFGVREGDKIPLPALSGIRDYTVYGVFYDYSTDQGLILIDRQRFLDDFGDAGLSTIPVFLRPGASTDQVRREIVEILDRPGEAVVQTNREIREKVLEIFDQTFVLTKALELIAVAVAVLGVISALLASVVERTRETGILRAVGCAPSQLRRIVLTRPR
ncbi:MAG: ABC transporter permease [Candidatus Tectomicrobia bacterium]|uniref:ABC transporter permease n=1 Tax=Tectimicrobiota bacterium TaxID=2528274 RepID=A0A932LZ90_UNCTE|nr:ABC transporter permease [Candidatus Tectomicrobia bacterium]